MKKRLPFIAITCAVILLDFSTKKIVITYVNPYESIEILPFLHIVNVRNRGAAFGIFSNLDNNVFILASILAIIGISLYIFKTTDRLELSSLSLILGGAIGNLIDRIKIKQVIDFIDFFVNDWHWPAFNIADSALSIGILLFLVANIRHLLMRKKVRVKL